MTTPTPTPEPQKPSPCPFCGESAEPYDGDFALRHKANCYLTGLVNREQWMTTGPLLARWNTRADGDADTRRLDWLEKEAKASGRTKGDEVSDTPRTDAVAGYINENYDGPPTKIVSADFARTLERELARALSILPEEWKELPETIAEQVRELNSLRTQLADAQRERDALIAECKKLPNSPPGFANGPMDRLHWTVNHIAKTWDAGKVLFLLREMFGTPTDNNAMLEKVKALRADLERVTRERDEAIAWKERQDAAVLRHRDEITKREPGWEFGSFGDMFTHFIERYDQLRAENDQLRAKITELSAKVANEHRLYEMAFDNQTRWMDKHSEAQKKLNLSEQENDQLRARLEGKEQ